tara:strand:- start:687 stop:1793 length:1107 start_codon:yes stop_codon:yes gene_type:complete
MKVKKLIIKTNSKNYPIYIGSNIVSKLVKILNNNSIKFQKCLLVIDKNVPKKFISKIKKNLNQFDLSFHTFNPTEQNKNIVNVNKILKILLSKKFSRQDALIAIGGGITGDVSGFASSIFKRGLKFINVPTTLLSQVDSSIGGKTGVNTIQGKNLIGSFYQPDLVISDTNFLKSLSKREVVCGYAEILKHSLIDDKNFYNFLNKNISKILNLKSPFLENAIYKSCQIKKNVVQKDENETNYRKILNFGHTFAHAYEGSLSYSKKLNHGEAVLLGINSAAKFSYKKNFLSYKDYSSIISHLKNSNLPCNLKKFFSIKDIKNILFFMTSDKKNKLNKINLILLKKIGSTIIDQEYTKSVLKIFLRKELLN